MKSFLCKCSFIEIYNEQIYDLLDSVSTSLFLREDIKRGVFVEGAVEKYAASAAEAYQVSHMLTSNSCKKTTLATDLNSFQTARVCSGFLSNQLFEISYSVTAGFHQQNSTQVANSIFT